MRILPAIILALLLSLPAASEIRDLTLKDAVRLALEQNHNIKVARENVTQAMARYEQLNALKIPTLNLNGQLSAQSEVAIDTSGLLQAIPANLRPPNFPSSFVVSEAFQQQANLSLDLLISTFGRVENQIKGAFLNAKAEAENFEVSSQDLVFQAESAFLDVLTAKEGVSTARLILASNRDHLEEVQVFLKEGLVSRFDMVKAELEVSKAVESLSAALNEQDLAQATLLFVLNEQPPFRYNPVAPKDPEVDSKLSLPQLKEVALRSRPEMRVADLSLDAAHRLVDAAYAESNPTLTLSLSYFRQGGSTLNPVELPQAILGFQIPLFDGGVRKAKVKEAESSLRSLESSAALLTEQVKLDVEKAWLAYAQAEVQLKTAIKNLETATLSHKMANARYTHGISTSLELEDALRSLNDARTNLVKAHHNRARAFSQLERALGTDISERRLDQAFVDKHLEVTENAE